MDELSQEKVVAELERERLNILNKRKEFVASFLSVMLGVTPYEIQGDKRFCSIYESEMAGVDGGGYSSVGVQEANSEYHNRRREAIPKLKSIGITLSLAIKLSRSRTDFLESVQSDLIDSGRLRAEYATGNIDSATLSKAIHRIHEIIDRPGLERRVTSEQRLHWKQELEVQSLVLFLELFEDGAFVAGADTIYEILKEIEDKRDGKEVEDGGGEFTVGRRMSEISDEELNDE